MKGRSLFLRAWDKEAIALLNLHQEDLLLT
jgi:hypothetical protein